MAPPWRRLSARHSWGHHRSGNGRDLRLGSGSQPTLRWSVHIVYRPSADQIPNSDAEFSRSSIAERREAGYRDMRAALAAAPWQHQEMPAHLGALVHRVELAKVSTRPEPNLHTTTDKPAAA